MNKQRTSPSVEQPCTFPVGCAVFLRGCRVGMPGVVLRQERGRLAVLWGDLGPSFIGRHRPETLIRADVAEREL